MYKIVFIVLTCLLQASASEPWLAASCAASAADWATTRYAFAQGAVEGNPLAPKDSLPAGSLEDFAVRGSIRDSALARTGAAKQVALADIRHSDHRRVRLRIAAQYGGGQ